MHYRYQNEGTCSKFIDFDLDDGVVRHVVFTRGCNGNLKGIGRLVEGRQAAEIAGLLRGTLCRNKGTSCPDQLAVALEQALSGQLAPLPEGASPSPIAFQDDEEED